MNFRNELPKYRNKAFSVIPLNPSTHRPSITGWPAYSMRRPGPDELDRWSDIHGDDDVGLVLGPSTGLVAISLVTADPRVRKMIEGILPATPWAHADGGTDIRLYRYADTRSAVINDHQGKPIVKICAAGSYVGLPQSVERDPGSNLHDLDTEAFPALPPDIEAEILDALKAAGVAATSALAEGGRVPASPVSLWWREASWKAAELSWDIVQDKRSFVEARDEALDWIWACTAATAENDADPEKIVIDLLVWHIKEDVQRNRNTALPVGWDNGLSSDEKQDLGLEFGPEDLALSREDICDRLIEDLRADHCPLSENYRKAMRTALEHVARNKKLNSDTDPIFYRMKKISGENLGLMRQIRRDLHDFGGRDVNQTVIAKELKSVLQRHGEIRAHNGKLWQYSGSLWQEIEKHEIETVIARRSGHLPTARKQYEHEQVRELVKTIEKQALASDDAPAGINFANGLLAEDGTLVPHHADHGMTYVLPYSYRPEACHDMPLFNQFLLDCWGPDADCADKIKALQEAMGVTLMGKGTAYQRAILLYGMGGSDKSRIPALLRALLPPGAACSLKPTDLHDRFLPAELFGKIMNFAGELSESRKISGDFYKMLVSGETMTVQRKRQKPFQMNSKATHWFCSNHLPLSDDRSEGFLRRWLILEFNHPVPFDRQVKDLEQRILENEAEAIIAWAIEGYKRLKWQNGYTIPASHHDALDEMTSRINPAQYFVQCSGVVVISDDAVTEVKEVWDSYWKYCLGKGIKKKLNMPDFTQELTRLAGECGFHVVRLGKSYVAQGLRIEY